MAIYKAKVKYTDHREIIVEADSDDEARAKYDAGDWVSEDTVDFYSEEETQPLTREGQK